MSPPKQDTSNARQSSNNPYKHVSVSIAPSPQLDQVDPPPTTFMNFNIKSPSSSTVPSLERSYTQRIQSVNIQDFTNAFEQVDPLPPPPPPPPPTHQDDIEDFPSPHSKQQPPLQDFYTSMYDATDDMDYSDTAKLTDHPAGMARDDSPPPSRLQPTTARSIRRTYQPALIDRQHNHNIERISLRKQLADYAALISLQLRNTAKRIVNIENINDAILLSAATDQHSVTSTEKNYSTTTDAHLELGKGGDASSSHHRHSSNTNDSITPLETDSTPAMSETIPMTPTSSRHGNHPYGATSTTLPSSITTIDAKKRRILLVGRSCWLFGPDNACRKWIARLLLWK